MTWGTRRILLVRRAIGAIAVVSTIALAGACGSDGGGDGTKATTTSAAPVDPAAAGAYVDPGPYDVGTTTLELDGRKVEVWYPADDVPAGTQPVVFEIRDLLPENLKSVVPDDLNPKYPTDAYLEVPASADGPFPLVLFAHGYAAYPTEYQFLLTHLASWGMVVAGPDFNERGLLAALSGSSGTTDETAVMLDTQALLQQASDASTGLLSGLVDSSNTGTIGHSAGVSSAVGAAAAEPTVKTFVAMSGGRAPGSAAATGTSGTTVPDLPIPAKPGMVVTGGKDEVAGYDRVRAFFDALETPKRLVVVDEAGHNAFNDLCLIGRDQGGLLEIARQVGIDPPEQIARLFLSGCAPEYLAAERAWPATRHFVTAQLRYYLGIDPEPIGLGSGNEAFFSPVGVTFVVEE
jgi:predicted dienelactone hydrolase